ncbi:hypothetical protein MHY85_00345 [Cellulomonas sp. ACRRI]|uniref:hypothetical protein n=1 Tax=Cellulomonas sp. ACRRI TaxID=2918188 RepID=UPI001EF168DF|nr:hypothetical protein [Cellulomonas sp. ACRRI]MCG7284419.1 hypothetical protein [Cellulomonas sp. ACRRI]
MRAGRDVLVGAVAGAVLLAVAGCAPGADIEIANQADDDVTVRLGDEERTEVGDGGGALLLDVTECYGPPLVVTYADAREVVVDDDLCPGDLLRVTQDHVDLVRAADRAASGDGAHG